MDKLQNLIQPDVHSAAQLRDMGHDEWSISRYCQMRNRKWSVGTQIFRKMFSNLGTLFVHKEYQPFQQNMLVTVYGPTHDILAQKGHVDPLFALAECAKDLNREDDFLAALMSGLKV